jgi:DNA-binding NtrC family response regulator
VAGIVRGHRCAIDVRSMEHGGTTFAIYFLPSNHLVKPLPLPDTPAPVLRLSGKALIIDDEPMTSRATKRLVEKIGLTADQAWDGEDALVRFGPHLGDYTVVILDMIMPRLNGAETFERLRQLRPGVPVVMYSGFDDNMANACLRQPHTTFVPKPFTAQRLVEAIVRVTGA